MPALSRRTKPETLFSPTLSESVSTTIFPIATLLNTGSIQQWPRQITFGQLKPAAATCWAVHRAIPALPLSFKAVSKTLLLKWWDLTITITSGEWVCMQVCVVGFSLCCLISAANSWWTTQNVCTTHNVRLNDTTARVQNNIGVQIGLGTTVLTMSIRTAGLIISVQTFCHLAQILVQSFAWRDRNPPLLQWTLLPSLLLGYRRHRHRQRHRHQRLLVAGTCSALLRALPDCCFSWHWPGGLEFSWDQRKRERERDTGIHFIRTNSNFDFASFMRNLVVI